MLKKIISQNNAKKWFYSTNVLKLIYDGPVIS